MAEVSHVLSCNTDGVNQLLRRVVSLFASQQLASRNDRSESSLGRNPIARRVRGRRNIEQTQRIV